MGDTDPQTTDVRAEEKLERLVREILKADPLRPDANEALWNQLVHAYIEVHHDDEDLEVSDSDLNSIAKSIIVRVGESPAALAGGTVEKTSQILIAIRDKVGVPSPQKRVEGTHQVAEPVTAFNGQFVQESKDIKIDGSGILFELKRIYKNQIRYNGPLGCSWDHNYNLWLRVSDERIYRSDGQLHEDVYSIHPTFGYWVPPDGQNGIIVENGTSYVWRSPKGERFIYQQDTAHPFLHRIKRIEDKHGNYLEFVYIGKRLHIVEVNNSQRLIEFSYDELDRITAIRDCDNREWRYDYDDFGDLVSVTTPSTDRYRNGLTTLYEYSSSQFSSNELQHNLTRIIDPAGQMYLENEFGTNPGMLSYNRVIRQRQGGGERYFEYQDIVEDFEFDYSDMERPAHQTNLVERNGHYVHYIHNKFGNLILKEEHFLQDGLLKHLQWRYRYNADGSLTALLTPSGSLVQYYYGRDHFLRRHHITDNDEVKNHDQLTIQERLAFGNLLAVVKRVARFDFGSISINHGAWSNYFPDVLDFPDSSDVVRKFSYESDYQQLKTSSDPRYTLRADPDFPEDARYHQTLTTYEYTGPTHDPNLHLARIKYPDVTLPDGTIVTNVIEEFEYREKGRLERSTDAEDVITEFEYFEPSPVNTDAAKKEGYLKKKTIDTGPGGLANSTEYQVNNRGVVTAVISPKALGAPLGHFTTTFDINELDQRTRTVSSRPFSYETRTFYDRNGLVERIERDLRDENNDPIGGGGGGVEIKTYDYDEQNNLISESLGGQDVSTRLITYHRYNESDKRINTVLPRGNQIRRSYDARSDEASVTRGAGTTDSSTIRTEYSGDGLKIKSIDGRGNATRYEYDIFGRLAETVDPLGNITYTNYDKSDNVIQQRIFEKQPDGTYLLLRRIEYQYDEMNRKILERRNLFQDPPPSTNNPQNDFAATPGPGILVETKFFYDRKGRLIRTINPNGQQTVLEYDALDRKTLERDALGNYTKFFYDANGNTIRRDIHELVTNPVTGSLVREDVFSTLYEYDELDRMIASTDSMGNETRFIYDSRNNLIRQVDPLGNIKEIEHDVYGRKISEILEMRDTGRGGGSLEVSAMVRYNYDQNGNLLELKDPKGFMTERVFDSLDRIVTTRYADSTEEQIGYDKNGNIIFRTDNNHNKRTYIFDELNCMRHMDLDVSGINSGLTVEGSTFEDCMYDALGRMVSGRNNFATIQRKHDSLGRIYEETTAYDPTTTSIQGTFSIRREFDLDGNVSSVTYPTGRIIRYHRDMLGRIKRVENVTKGAEYPGSTHFPDNYDIVNTMYQGLRKSKMIFGNLASTTYAFDGSARLIQIAHMKHDNTNLLTLQQLYDAAGNIRIKKEVRDTNTGKSYAYKYDSVYQITKIGQNNDSHLFDPSTIHPSTVPLPVGLLTGQEFMNALTSDLGGSLDQNQADFTYRYDLNGNREEERQAGAQAPLFYASNNLNQYTSIGTIVLDYDPNGNLISDGQWQYIYDFTNRLSRISKPGSNDKVRFFYDLYGRRILERRNGTIVQFVYDEQNLLMEYRDGHPVAQYVHGEGLDQVLQIAVKDNNNEGGEFWYHTDHLGSVQLLTDRSAVEAVRYRYHAFGDLLSVESTSTPAAIRNPLLYQARPFLDQELSVYDFRSRQYSPLLGRFLQRDPVGLRDGINLYTFLGNNPLTFVDPFGTEKHRTYGAVPSRGPKVPIYAPGRGGPTEEVNKRRKLGFRDWSLKAGASAEHAKREGWEKTDKGEKGFDRARKTRGDLEIKLGGEAGLIREEIWKTDPDTTIFGVPAGFKAEVKGYSGAAEVNLSLGGIGGKLGINAISVEAEGKISPGGVDIGGKIEVGLKAEIGGAFGLKKGVASVQADLVFISFDVEVDVVAAVSWLF